MNPLLNGALWVIALAALVVVGGQLVVQQGSGLTGSAFGSVPLSPICFIPSFNMSQTYSAFLNSAQGSQAREFWNTVFSLSISANSQRCYYYTSSQGERVFLQPNQFIGVKGDARFDYTNWGVGDLVEYLNSEGDFNYTVDFNAPIPTNLDFSQSRTIIPFMGGQYKVLEIVGSSPAIQSIKLQNLARPSNVFEVWDGKGFPYNPDNNSGPWDWKAQLVEDVTPGVSRLKSIVLLNSRLTWDSTNPLYSENNLHGFPQNSAIFLDETSHSHEGFARVWFNGFEDKPTTSVEIGNNAVSYNDPNGVAHSIPFFINLSASASGNSFAFDTKTLYYKTNTNDVNFRLSTAFQYLNGIPAQLFPAGPNAFRLNTDNGPVLFTANGQAASVDLNTVNYRCLRDSNSTLNCGADGNIAFSRAPIPTSTTGDFMSPMAYSINHAMYYDDGNISRPVQTRAFRMSPILLEGANSQTYQYALYVNETYSPSVWLLLDDANFYTQYDKTISFKGTDMTEAGYLAQPQYLSSVKYYFPDVFDIGASPADTNYLVAHFEVKDQNAPSWDFVRLSEYIDTATGLPLFFPNSFLNNYTRSVYYENSTNNVTWFLRNDAPYLQKAFTDFGSLVEILGTDVNGTIIPERISYTMPQTQSRVEMTIVVREPANAVPVSSAAEIQ